MMSAHTRYIPISVLASVRYGEYRKKALDSGVAHYIEKPYRAETLIAAVKSVIGPGEKGERCPG